ncbi:hypothetical protein SpCBS45565_g01967 [Spizellomyces sp. 'palustris']|nr:hypothetical protein SpCBS45565_g01967 [Spizellomyces sp. 'palustris']
MRLLPCFALVAVAAPWIISAETDHLVLVGAEGRPVYNPSTLNVYLGDMVTFHVEDGPHSVTQTTGNNCDTLSSGIDSGKLKRGGRMAVRFIAPGIRWFTCNMDDHCHRDMRFAVNVIDNGTDSQSGTPVSQSDTPVAPLVETAASSGVDTQIPDVNVKTALIAGGAVVGGAILGAIGFKLVLILLRRRGEKVKLGERIGRGEPL